MDFTTVDQSTRLMKIGVPIESANCYYAYQNGLYGNPIYRPINFSMVDIALSHLGATIIPCWTSGQLIQMCAKITKRPLTISYGIEDLLEFMITIMENCPPLNFSKLNLQ